MRPAAGKSPGTGRESPVCLTAWLFAFALIFGSRPAITAAELSPAESAALDAAMVAEMERQEVVGLAVGIIREGNVAYLRGYGFEDREAGIPVTSDTMFRWASISKTVTAVAAMRLVESGQLDLMSDVRDLVPEFPDHGALITPRHLLCHQSGIVHYTNGRVIRTRRDYDRENPFEDVVLALDRFRESPLLFQPGGKYSYSTHAYILLSAVVERAAGVPFARHIKETITTPFDLPTLRPDYQWEEIPHRAVGYRRRGTRIVRSSDTDVSWKLGGGGFISNIDDLAGWAAALLGGELVSKETERRMWTAQKTASGDTTSMSLGFSVSGREAGLIVSHNGSQEKAKTRMVIRPADRSGVVVMSNSEYADPGAFTAVARAALAAPPDSGD